MDNIKEDNIPKQIRFGVMCDDFYFKKWEINCIKHLQKINYVKLKLIILNDNKPKSSYSCKKNRIFYKLYWKIIVSKFSIFKRINCIRLFQNIEILKTKTIKNEKFYEYFKKSQEEES